MKKSRHKKRGPPDKLMDPFVGSGRFPDQMPAKKSKPPTPRKEREEDNLTDKSSKVKNRFSDFLDIAKTMSRLLVIFQDFFTNLGIESSGIWEGVSWIHWVLSMTWLYRKLVQSRTAARIKKFLKDLVPQRLD